MKKPAGLLLTAALCVAGSTSAPPWASADSGVTGFWSAIDDQTGRAKSVVALYVYQGTLYGRIILVYEDDGITIKDDIYSRKFASPFLEGNPPFCGLDIIWGLDPGKNGRWTGGSVMDPGDLKQKPRVYDAVVWLRDGHLIVRGKIAFLGKNQVWKRFDMDDFPRGFQVPDYTSFTPAVPQAR
jgi:uncharacterized protein (DUF2147 family)